MYHYTECGLQNVWLRNGYRKEKTPHGPAVSFTDVAGLHRLIGRTLALRPQLTGAEVRFLRKELSLSQAALAQMLGCTEQNVSLWERRGRMPKVADRMLRLLYLEQLDGNVNVRKLIDAVKDLDAQPAGKLVFEEVAGHWPVAA
jgi:DNA-binding transcriptional regulator YiaG